MTMRTSVWLCCLLAACGGETKGDGPWRRVQQPTAAEKAQLDKAVAAKDALASRLLAALTEAMQAGGPEQAIEVCHLRAPELATAVAGEQQVRMGRTSTKLRNPKNLPPDWAHTHVAGEGKEPVQFAGPGGELGALFPIRLAPQCIVCHGKPEQLAPEVKPALAMHYPTDQATGFAPGDLRGWFWVEVPKAP